MQHTTRDIAKLFDTVDRLESRVTQLENKLKETEERQVPSLDDLLNKETPKSTPARKSTSK